MCVSFTRSHNKNEIVYLLKIMLGLAMQGPNSSEMAKRVTSLDKRIQDVLMELIQEVLATMKPEGLSEDDVEDLPLREFDDLLAEEGNGPLEDDWSDWDDAASPAEAPLQRQDSEMEKEYHRLQELVIQYRVEKEDFEKTLSVLTKQRDEALQEIDALHSQLQSHQTANLQMQKKIEELSTPVESSSQLSASQTSMFQEELERAEAEAAQLRAKVSQLEKTVQDTKSDAARDAQKLQTQISVLSEQNLQLQKSEQLCQTYKKQLQELQNGHLDVGEYQAKLVALEAELRGKAELENRVASYLEENKRLQSEVLRYQQRCGELEEKVASLQSREKELSNDLALLQQRNDSLQLLVSGPSSEATSPVSHSNSTVALDQLLSESPSPSGKTAAPTTAAQATAAAVNVRNSPEYLEQANELLLANERSIVLNVREGSARDG